MVEYKTIKNFDKYKIGTDGTVLSLKIYTDGRKVWKTLKPYKAKAGLLYYVCLSKDGISYKFYICHLIISEFLNVTGKQVVFFKDGNYDNATLDNLEVANSIEDLYQIYKSKFIGQSGVEYKDIPGHLGYIASSTGEIWSCKSQGFNGFGEWKIVPQHQNPVTKRPTLSIMRWDGRKTYEVHKLIMLAFLGEIPEGLERCHNDGNFMNNNITNLRYDTRESNNLDKIKHRTMPSCEDNFNSTLTNEQVKNIKIALKRGVNIEELSKSFNTSKRILSRIKHGHTWKHITIEENTNV